MTSDEADYELAVHKWMATHFRSTACPGCGEAETLQPGDVVSINFANIRPGDTRLAARFIPVECSECGYVLWMNAKRLGLDKA